jgi:hypothetical protein
VWRPPFHQIEWVIQLHETTDQTPNERVNAGLRGVGMGVGSSTKNGGSLPDVIRESLH